MIKLQDIGTFHEISEIAIYIYTGNIGVSHRWNIVNQILKR